MAKEIELAMLPNELMQAPSHNYIKHATSDNTRKAYQTDIRQFMTWGGLLPTTPDVIIRYLETHAETLNSRTLTRRLTALKNWHTYQGFPDPTSHPLVKKTLTGIKNVHGKPKDKAPAMTLEVLITLCGHFQSRGGSIYLRNNALL